MCLRVRKKNDKILFFCILKVTEERSRILIKMPRIPNTVFFNSGMICVTGSGSVLIWIV
jgi:hypothetical protein